MTFLGTLCRSHVGLNHARWSESRVAPAPSNFLTVSRPSAMSPSSGPILETHATKNGYRRFSSHICRPLRHFAIRPLRTAVRGLPDGPIQKPGLDV
jgi:hypothetical protein